MSLRRHTHLLQPRPRQHKPMHNTMIPDQPGNAIPKMAFASRTSLRITSSCPITCSRVQAYGTDPFTPGSPLQQTLSIDSTIYFERLELSGCGGAVHIDLLYHLPAPTGTYRPGAHPTNDELTPTDARCKPAPPLAVPPSSPSSQLYIPSLMRILTTVSARGKPAPWRRSQSHPGTRRRASHAPSGRARPSAAGKDMPRRAPGQPHAAALPGPMQAPVRATADIAGNMSAFCKGAMGKRA